jgi:hypothetical protein
MGPALKLAAILSIQKISSLWLRHHYWHRENFMISKLEKLFKNNLFLVLMTVVFLDTIFFAVVVSTIQVPPDAILDSGLHEVISVFEGQ